MSKSFRHSIVLLAVIIAAVAMIAAALLAGACGDPSPGSLVTNATALSTSTPPGSGSVDPTVAPTPTYVPPPPDQLATRAAQRAAEGEPAPQPTRYSPQVPDVSTVTIGVDGKYRAPAGGNGCEWIEAKRVKDPASGAELIHLANSCDDAYFLEYDPVTKALTLWVS